MLPVSKVALMGCVSLIALSACSSVQDMAIPGVSKKMRQFISINVVVLRSKFLIYQIGLRSNLKIQETFILLAHL